MKKKDDNNNNSKIIINRKEAKSNLNLINLIDSSLDQFNVNDKKFIDNYDKNKNNVNENICDDFIRNTYNNGDNTFKNLKRKSDEVSLKNIILNLKTSIKKLKFTYKDNPTQEKFIFSNFAKSEKSAYLEDLKAKNFDANNKNVKGFSNFEQKLLEF